MYLQIGVAAKMLGMSRQWLHALIERGAVSVSTIAGRRVVVDDEQFRALKRTHHKRNGRRGKA